MKTSATMQHLKIVTQWARHVHDAAHRNEDTILLRGLTAQLLESCTVATMAADKIEDEAKRAYWMVYRFDDQDQSYVPASPQKFYGVQQAQQARKALSIQTELTLVIKVTPPNA